MIDEHGGEKKIIMRDMMKKEVKEEGKYDEAISV